jgi:hypothetical protein
MRVEVPPDFAAAAGEKIGPVLEILALSEDTQVVIARLPDGKMRVTSKSWDEAKVILPDQVLELRMVEGRIRIARKEKRRDAGDLQRGAEPAPVEGEITEFLGAELPGNRRCSAATPRPAYPTGKPRPVLARGTFPATLAILAALELDAVAARRNIAIAKFLRVRRANDRSARQRSPEPGLVLARLPDALLKRKLDAFHDHVIGFCAAPPMQAPAQGIGRNISRCYASPVC